MELQEKVNAADISPKIILDNVIFSLQRAGGISIVWQQLINQLNAHGIYPHYLEYEGASNNLFRQKLDITNDVIEFKSSRFLAINRFCKPHINSDTPFLFHSSYYRTTNNRWAKNITTVHDFTYEYYIKGSRRKIHSWQKFAAIRNSEAIVCISESTKRDLINFLPDIDKNKIHVIYNGVSEDYRPLENSPYSVLGDFVLFVGSRVSYKNFDFLVESIKGQNLKLVIVGKELSEKERAFLEYYLGKDRYIQFPNVSNEELNKLYNAAFSLVYPSSYEGFGIPILEAQRAGCPVIALGSSSIPEVIGETPLLMKSLDVSEFKSKLQLLKQPSVRIEIVDAGMSNCQRFSWERMGKEYIALYNSLF